MSLLLSCIFSVKCCTSFNLVIEMSDSHQYYLDNCYKFSSRLSICRLHYLNLDKSSPSRSLGPFFFHWVHALFLSNECRSVKYPCNIEQPFPNLWQIHFRVHGRVQCSNCYLMRWQSSSGNLFDYIWIPLAFSYFHFYCLVIVYHASDDFEFS